jgi:hypothetical protein
MARENIKSANEEPSADVDDSGASDNDAGESTRKWKKTSTKKARTDWWSRVDTWLEEKIPLHGPDMKSIGWKV